LKGSQLKLATFLEFHQNNRSDSFGVKPSLYWWGRTPIEILEDGKPIWQVLYQEWVTVRSGLSYYTFRISILTLYTTLSIV